MRTLHQLLTKKLRLILIKYILRKTQKAKKSKKTYMKLPYIGKYSKFAQNKIKHLCDTFCKETHISLVFSSTKLASFFQIKDKIPSALKSFVVYKFTCANCNVSYVGETCRHLDKDWRTSASSHIQTFIEPTCLQSSLWQVMFSDNWYFFF